MTDWPEAWVKRLASEAVLFGAACGFALGVIVMLLIWSPW